MMPEYSAINLLSYQRIILSCPRNIPLGRSRGRDSNLMPIGRVYLLVNYKREKRLKPDGDSVGQEAGEGLQIGGPHEKMSFFSKSLWTNSEYPNLLKNMFIWSL
jgi:hypothetical protein